MCFMVDNDNNMCKTWIKQLFTKYQILTKLPQISHFHKIPKFLKYNWSFLDQTILPYKCHGRDK